MSVSLKLSYLDVSSSFWQDYFHGVLLRYVVLVVMEESEVKHVSILLILIVEQMVSSRHVVALVPIYFPLSEHWVPGIDLKVHLV